MCRSCGEERALLACKEHSKSIDLIAESQKWKWVIEVVEVYHVDASIEK